MYFCDTGLHCILLISSNLRIRFPRVPQRLVLLEKSKEARPLRNGEIPGKYNAAGMPNIYGNSQVAGFWDPSSMPTPLFQGMGTWGWSLQVNSATGTASGKIIGMDASYVNSCYGRYGTVMPESADILCGIYLGRSSEV